MTPKAAFFFEKINKSNKPLARLNRERERERGNANYQYQE